MLNKMLDSYFKRKFSSYSETQIKAIKAISKGNNVLISSPTGTGKTLSAFAKVISDLIDLNQKNSLDDKIYCIYVSPLRALNNDIEKNLLEPIKDIENFENLSLGIRIAVRTGDTLQKERQKMLKKPPHILITTPESLALILNSKTFLKHLNELKYFIIDEIHALVDNKRGALLSILMERLSYIKEHQRIALSATISPLDEISKFLAYGRSCEIVDVSFPKKLRLNLVMPVKSYVSASKEELHKGIYDGLHKIIQNHRNTLIFTNTRAGTESVVHYLKEYFPKYYNDENISAHHSSLSRELRLNTEKRLKEGKLKLIVSSTSLELGIDIGYIDAVVLLNSPKSIIRALQRIGRSGHSLHAEIIAYFIANDFDELIESCIIRKAVIEKKLDRIKIIKKPLDVLTQQLLAMSLERRWEISEAYKLIKKSYCYKDLSYKEFISCLNYLAGKDIDLSNRNVYAKIWLDESSFYKRGKLTRMIYFTNLGVIPDEAKLAVFIEKNYIGSLDEIFAERLKKNDVFVLGGKSYEFLYKRGSKIYVRANPKRPPTVPAWYAESLPLSFDLANMIYDFRKNIMRIIAENPDKALQYIEKSLYLDRDTSRVIFDYFEKQSSFYEMKEDILYIERFMSKNIHYVFHTLKGRKVNDALSTALAYIISKKINKDIEISVLDNGFMITLPDSIALSKYFNELLSLSYAEFYSLLKNAVKNTLLFETRFRHNAVRFFMILRNYKGRTKSVAKQSMASKFIFSSLKDFEKHPVILETYREILEDVMDIENAYKVIQSIKKSSYKIYNLPHPSLFAANIASQMSNIIKLEDRLEFLKEIYFLISNKEKI